MLMSLPARYTLHKAQEPLEQAPRVSPSQQEFNAAFLRLQERCEPLSKEAYFSLSRREKEALTLLEDDSDQLKRHDQEVLRRHALSKGIDLGKAAYKKSAPVVYMSMLLAKLGYGSLEDVYQEYPQLKSRSIRRR